MDLGKQIHLTHDLGNGRYWLVRFAFVAAIAGKVEILSAPFTEQKPSRDAVVKLFSYHTAEARELWQKIDWVQGDVLDVPSLQMLCKG